MSSSLLEKSINKEDYEDYIDKILNIFRLSSKESSILYDLTIQDYQCVSKLSIINNSGNHKEYSDLIFECDESFYKNFIDSLIVKFGQEVEWVKKDIVNLDNDSLVTFRIITNNNDLFSIDGLSQEHAEYLSKLCENHFLDNEKKLLKVSNNSGIGNFWIFILMIIVLVLSFILIVMIIG